MLIFSVSKIRCNRVNSLIRLRQCVQVHHRPWLEPKTVHQKRTIVWKAVLRALLHIRASPFLSRSRVRRTTSISTSTLLFWTNARRNVLVSCGTYSWIALKCHRFGLFQYYNVKYAYVCVCFTGINDWDDFGILSQVLATSQAEYLESLKRQKDKEKESEEMCEQWYGQVALCHSLNSFFPYFCQST